MILSDCPDAGLRNPHRAAQLAEKAVELIPEGSDNWAALGVARYRDSQWEEARRAFDKSLQLGVGHVHWSDAIDWFFLAMSNWRLGQQDQARQCYDRAVQVMEKGWGWPTDVEQLRRLRAEAEELLNITEANDESAVEVK
jgi:uncharacterized protein HemY